MIDDKNRYILALSASGTVSCTYLRKRTMRELIHEAPEIEKYGLEEHASRYITIHGSESKFSVFTISCYLQDLKNNKKTLYFYLFFFFINVIRNRTELRLKKL